MSAYAAPSTSAVGGEPRVYSQTASAIALRARRAKQKAEVASLPSPDCSNRPTASSNRVVKTRNQIGGYSQSATAIASRKRRAEMTPENRQKMLEHHAIYNAAKRAQRSTENQEDFEDADGFIVLANEEVRVTQERYVVVISVLSSSPNALTVPLKTLPTHRLAECRALGSSPHWPSATSSTQH
jgi:hypothetical protein